MKITRRHVVATGVAILAIGPSAAPALASPGTGLTVMTLATANLEHKVHLDADRIKLRTKAPTIVRMQNLVLAAGARTGWHHHPGIVLVAVQSGAVTVWDSECNSTTYGPGQPAGAAFTESGDEPLEVTSSHGASVYATYLVPKVDPPEFRIESDPLPCS